MDPRYILHISLPTGGNQKKSVSCTTRKNAWWFKWHRFPGLRSTLRGDIDDWSEAFGIQGWSWSDLLPYFERGERREFDEPNIHNRDLEVCPLNQDCHGFNGVTHTSMSTWQVPFEKKLLLAFDEVSGLSGPEDPYNGSHLGFYRTLSTTNRVEKPIQSYAARGYLTPISGRANFIVLTNASPVESY